VAFGWHGRFGGRGRAFGMRGGPAGLRRQHGQQATPAAGPSGIERRLDAIQKQLDALRQELKGK
jgi:hypothetical protein